MTVTARGGKLSLSKHRPESLLTQTVALISSQDSDGFRLMIKTHLLRRGASINTPLNITNLHLNYANYLICNFGT